MGTVGWPQQLSSSRPRQRFAWGYWRRQYNSSRSNNLRWGRGCSYPSSRSRASSPNSRREWPRRNSCCMCRPGKAAGMTIRSGSNLRLKRVQGVGAWAQYYDCTAVCTLYSIGGCSSYRPSGTVMHRTWIPLCIHG